MTLVYLSTRSEVVKVLTKFSNTVKSHVVWSVVKLLYFSFASPDDVSLDKWNESQDCDTA